MFGSDQLVEAGHIENNAELFRCVAAVETVLEDKTFKPDPANTLASYLRPQFKQHGWDWPKSPLAWRRHFIEHHSGVFS